MQKEILTKENIKRDLREQHRGAIMAGIVFSVVLLPLVLLLLFLCFKIKDSLGTIVLIAPIAMLLMLCAMIFVAVCDSVKLFIIISKERYRIASDTVIRMKGKEGHRPASTFYKPYRLFFSVYGEYAIGAENHPWSEKFCLSDTGVYLYSAIGDAFYLVVTGKGKILAAYNKKLFDLQE